MAMYKIQNPNEVNRIVKEIAKNRSLERGDLFEIAKRLQALSQPGIKDIGYNVSVRDYGDENIAVKNARIHKGYSEITIDFPNSKDDDCAENSLSIHLEKVTKSGKVKDLRVLFHKDDEYYFDAPPGVDVIVVKHKKEKPDAEIGKERKK